MSIESRISNDDEQNSFVTHQRHTHFGSMVRQTSSIAINFRQVQTDLQIQYEHDKEVLNELNQRFQLFLDRIQYLQTQNAKYLQAIMDLRQQLSSIGISVEIEENFFSLKSNLLSIQNVNVDHQWDYELYQLQIAIYKKLIEIEQQSKTDRIGSLENELKQTISTLNSVRSSYDQLQRQIASLHDEGQHFLKQYLTLTSDWCNMKKQNTKSDLHLQILKSYIVFYKNLRSYSGQEVSNVFSQSMDSTEFWRLELDSIIKRIRHDFEVFYGNIRDQMVSYYENKTIELETNVKQAFEYQQTEYEQWTVVQEKLKIEYERIEKSLNYEREITIKLESTYSRLEAEFQSVQNQNEEQFEIQTTDLRSLQDTLSNMIYDVDEIRRSKSNLEVELIIYRQLLGVSEIETSPQVIFRQPQPVVIESSGKVFVKRQRKGPISIKECAPDGTYISLINSSTSRSIDVSKWILTRQIDSKTNLQYILPDGVWLEQGQELRIYAKPSRSKRDSVDESARYIKLINNNIVTWGEGRSIETFLFNQDGVEEASFFQNNSTERI